MADLLEADAKELSDALQQLQLKAPEQRRLRGLLESAAAGGEPLQNEESAPAIPDPTEALAAALQRQNLGHLAQPLADQGYLGAQDRAV